MTDKIVVLSTCGAEDEANRIARRLIERKLAACVSVLAGARSFYRWQGTVENAQEWLLIIKSSRAMFEQLRAGIEELHSYEVPEIVAIPIADGSADYMNWLQGELGDA